MPKWSRFEQSFKSATTYSDPLQTKLLTTFVSPLGETNLVYGFWEGGKTWRVRFAPDLAGRWTFETACSDPANRGLNLQRGAFLCTAPVGVTRFREHGSIRIARDHRHLEHEDGTPFLWLADAAWNGARLSEPKDWNEYAQVRAHQNFTAIEWAVASESDNRNSTLRKVGDVILPDLKFFQQLDARVETLNRAGLLSVIAPVWKTSSTFLDSLSEPQLTAWVRYLVARWGANEVLWLIATQSHSATSAAYYRASRNVFSESTHRPVILFTDQVRSTRNDDSFDDNWTDALGFVAGDFSGISPKEEITQLGIPVVFPAENCGINGGEGMSAAEIRGLLWQTLLRISPAGVSYTTGPVAEWNTSHIPASDPDPLWKKSLFLSGAKQPFIISSVFNSIPFWQLRPAPEIIVTQPGFQNANDFIAAARTDSHQICVFYVPASRVLEVSLDALPKAPILRWINPRTGETSTAVAVVGPRSIKLPTPDAGDWILIARSEH